MEVGGSSGCWGWGGAWEDEGRTCHWQDFLGLQEAVGTGSTNEEEHSSTNPMSLKQEPVVG